jgi:DNA invertase Pin-like site-specific DNA recombinase
MAFFLEGRLLFNVLAVVAEFESHLIKMRTRENVQRNNENAGPNYLEPKETRWR